MAPSACLVNVSRAGVVDEAALLVALRDPVTYPDRGAMRSCRLVAPRTLRVQEVPVPTPVGADLLVRVVATGICGSDLAAYRGTHPYKKAPAVLGHELVGVVTALGPEASGAEPGDLVSSAAFCPCGVCPSCRRGEVNLCPDRRSMSTPGWDGSFAEFVVLQPATTFVLPGAVSPRQGVLVEPLAIGRRAMRLAEGRGGTVVVLGAGTIGLSCLLSARRLGFARVVTTDVGPAKAARARAAGADDHLDAAEQDVAVALRGTADVTVVASGHPSVMAEALAVTRPGGLLVVVSYFDGPRSVDLNGMVSAGLTVAFSALATPEDFTDVIRWLAAGDLDPAPLVSHRFPLEDAQEAMALLDSGDPAAGKVVLDVSTTQDRTGGSG
jgi:2-desacetyl-2-hydroxyethyl bacteriochlorophyllide A dehydrogenase